MNINQNDVNGNIDNDSKKRKKGHGPLYWIIVVVGVTFIIAASFNIGMKVGNMVDGNNSSSDDKISNQTSNEENNSNVDENKETKITDKVKIDYLKKYIAILENLNLDTSSVKVSDSAGIYYFMNNQIYALDKLEKKDITMDDATTAIVASKQAKKDYIANQSLSPTILKELGESPETFEYIPVNDFIDDYKTLFGLDNISTKNVDANCETYAYDNKINAFVLIADGCGTAGPVAIQKTYIYDITEDTDNVYVYLAYGVTGQNEKGQYLAYTDYTMNKKYTGTVTKDFTINESNYKDFSKYKYTFTKNSDGTYTFSEFSLLK